MRRLLLQAAERSWCERGRERRSRRARRRRVPRPDGICEALGEWRRGVVNPDIRGAIRQHMTVIEALGGLIPDLEAVADHMDP